MKRQSPLLILLLGAVVLLIQFVPNFQAHGAIKRLSMGQATLPGADNQASVQCAAGKLDPLFGNAGKITADFAAVDIAYDLAIQADGKVVVVGGAMTDFALARFDSNGALDPTFGGGTGKVVTDLADTNDCAYAVAIQEDGKFIVGGETGADFALARYASTVLSPTSKWFTYFADSGSITLTEPNDCNWFAASNAPWIILTSAARGSGSTVLTYEVATNPAAVHRVGTISVAGQTFSVRQAARFNDVPPTHPFYVEINKLSAFGITLGCGNNNYCPEGWVTREQMAVFISRALGQLNPPVPAQQRFQDVTPNMPSYPFVEELASRGITVGCSESPPLYCPQNVVSRAEMAVFLIKALGTFQPPTPAQQRFLDVLPGDFAYEFIEVLAARGITAGCLAEPPMYCPSAPVTRAQMAAFLGKAFNL
jgi:uncharacterized delta-60 repeat protein